MNKKVRFGREPVSTWLVHAHCMENDGKCPGRMQFTGQSLMMSPPLYVHVCSRCSTRVDLDAIYPKIEHHPDGGI